MTSFRTQLLPSLVAGGFLFAIAGSTFAQNLNEPGIVRVSDGRITSNQLPPLPPISQVNGTQGTVVESHCPQCQQHVQGTCPHGSHYGACPQGCHAHRCTHHVHAFLDWFNPHGAGTHSPDHGYAVPIKSPIYRRGVAYNKYFPDAWMGIQNPDMTGAQRAPMVYMPTDTTQLGYYYQHAPQWLPNRNMIPPAPNPKLYHYTCHDKTQNGYGPNGNCPQGVNGQVIESYPTIPGQVIESQQGIPGNVIESHPNAAPIESAPSPSPVPAPPPAIDKISL